MESTSKMEKVVMLTTGISLLGTIISLFFNSWKITVIWLIVYICSSDLFIGIKVAKLSIGNKVNDVLEMAFSGITLENEEAK